MATHKFGQVQIVQQNTIHVDPTWNSRRDVTAETSNEESSGGFTGLKGTIAGDGQNDAVCVRPYGKGSKEYSLVAGFRRFEALAQLHAEKAPVKGLKAGEIKIIVEDLDEAAARDRNLIENLVRDNLSGPDQVFGLSERLKLEKGGIEAANQTVIAAKFAISQSFAGKCIRIAKDVKPAILKVWRESPANIRPSIDAMVGISAMAKGEQDEAYSAAVAKMNPDRVAGEGGPKKWIAGSRVAAASLGTQLGKAQQREVLEVYESFFTVENLEKFVKIKKAGKGSATEREQQSIVDACEKAYTTAINTEDTPDDEKADKNVKKKSANGQNATA